MKRLRNGLKEVAGIIYNVKRILTLLSNYVIISQ